MCSLQPHIASDNAATALPRAQRAIRQCEDGSKILATSWSSGVLICAASSEALDAGIAAYAAAC